jgi:hypothetical protein
MRIIYARDAQVADSGEEITLLFEGKEAGQSQKIILSPFAAKRLSVLLNYAISDHEAEAALESRLPVPEGEAGQGKSHRPGDIRDEAAVSRGEKGDRLISLVRRLGVHYGIEDSFKLFDGTVLANRFLIGFKKETISGDNRQPLTDVCLGIGMPQTCLAQFGKGLPDANIILFGYEENETGSVYKAYLEFGSQFDKAILSNPREPEALLIHLGFKWNAEKNTAYTTARYVCYPSFSVETIQEKLSNVFYANSHRPSFEMAKGIIELAAKRMRPDEFLYTEVMEDNNSRLSFDINMYRANLRMRDLYPLLSRIFRHYRIPDDTFHKLYDRVKLRIFGHLSGGIDREGRDFLTVYHGVKGSSR